MPTELHLPPVYGLSLIRLASGDGTPPWPGLLLHSRSLTWPLDSLSRPLDLLDDVNILARRAGLSQITEPFTADVPPADPQWTFRLPTLRRNAQLANPSLTVTMSRQPNITDDWWRMAISHGGKCRLLIAVCVVFPDDPAVAAGILGKAAYDGRVYGATIGVEF